MMYNVITRRGEDNSFVHTLPTLNKEEYKRLFAWLCKPYSYKPSQAVFCFMTRRLQENEYYQACNCGRKFRVQTWKEGKERIQCFSCFLTEQILNESVAKSNEQVWQRFYLI